MKEKKLTNRERHILRFITDVEILTIETEQLLEGVGTHLKHCQSWEAIKLNFDNCIRSIKIDLDRDN